MFGIDFEVMTVHDPHVTSVAADESPPIGTSEATAGAIAEAFRAAGIELMFGVPGGGANLDLVGAAEAAGVRFVLTHTESAAAIMAATYGEITGRPGACLATRGPGATSIANGVAHAFLDRSPLVVVTDAVASSDRSRITRQRLDHQALFEPITKWSTAIGGARAIDTASAAVRVAISGRPGPVHLDVLKGADTALEPLPRDIPFQADDLKRAARILGESRNPVFLLGLGARAAAKELRAVLRQAPWPVLTTYKAKGVIPESWSNVAGIFTGGTAERGIVAQADLIVTVGLDTVELIPAPWPYEAPIVALSAWECDARYFDPTVEVVGPITQLVRLLAPRVPKSRASRKPRDWQLQLEEALDIAVPGIRPQDVVRAAQHASAKGTAATVDAGAHMLVAMTHWKATAPNDVLISSGHATMGYALPAAIAASLAGGFRPVVCFVGDGGLGMTLAELETLGRLCLPVTVVVFNDAALSLIEIKQRSARQGGTGAVRYGAVDFARIASAMGVAGRRVTSEGELESVLTAAIAHGRPALIDVLVDASGYPAILDTLRGERGLRLFSGEAQGGTSSAPD